MWCWRIFRLLNCKCRKKLVDKLVEECSENINGNEMIYNKFWVKKYVNNIYIYIYINIDR